MTTLIERAIETVRKEPKYTKESVRADSDRAHILFDGNTIWGGVRK